jgi:hypothetical protein
MDTTVAALASIGVDIGKEVFHLVGFGTDGKIAFDFSGAAKQLRAADQHVLGLVGRKHRRQRRDGLH